MIKVQIDSQMQKALDELRWMIQSRWSETTFFVSYGDDPEGVYLDAIVDVEDTDLVMDAIIDRLITMQVDEKLPIYVIVGQSLQRMVTALKSYRQLQEYYLSQNVGSFSLRDKNSKRGTHL